MGFFFAASDDDNSLASWHVLQPTPKALSLPSVLSRPHAPRIRSPFQLTDLDTASSASQPAVADPMGPLKFQAGLQRPMQDQHSVESLPYPEHWNHQLEHVAACGSSSTKLFAISSVPFTAKGV